MIRKYIWLDQVTCTRQQTEPYLPSLAVEQVAPHKHTHTLHTHIHTHTHTHTHKSIYARSVTHSPWRMLIFAFLPWVRLFRMKKVLFIKWTNWIRSEDQTLASALSWVGVNLRKYKKSKKNRNRSRPSLRKRREKNSWFGL